jgi:hypothetical protein
MTSILALPFVAIWRLFEILIGLTGRLLALVLGLVLLIIGGIFSLTGVGAVLGIPLMLVGLLLLIRAIF